MLRRVKSTAGRLAKLKPSTVGRVTALGHGNGVQGRQAATTATATATATAINSLRSTKGSWLTASLPVTPTLTIARSISTSTVLRKSAQAAAAAAAAESDEDFVIKVNDKRRVRASAAAVHHGSVTRHHPRDGSDRIRQPKKRLPRSEDNPGVLFEDMAIDVRLKKALTQDFGYEEASPAQHMCFDPSMDGKDVVLKAKTGTGKTIGFLLPAIQKHFREGVKLAQRKPRRVPILVITPTRELAKQVELEASKLLRYLPRSLKAQSCIGGTPRGTQMKRLQRVPPFVMAATPGRLLDMIRTCGWEDVFDELRVLVLDEADRLLDMGFRAEIEAILKHLNEHNGERQTMLFSATFPPDVERVASLACLNEVEHIDAPDVVKEETASTVAQRSAEVEMGDLLPALHSVIHSHIAERALHRKRAKVMVFFPTASQTQFFSQLFDRDTYKLYTLHARMQQSKRDRVSGTFRTAKEGVLFTTDVSARGIDYPDVSLVVQVGLPSAREQYVHRVGRTGRGGSSGDAVLLTTPEEAGFVRDHLKGLPISAQPLSAILKSTTSTEGNDQGVTAAAAADDDDSADSLLESSRKHIARRFDILRKYDEERGGETYLSFLGHYRSMITPMGMSKPDLLKFAEKYAVEALQLPEPPHLSQMLLGKMGLDDRALMKTLRVSDDRRRRRAHDRMPSKRFTRPSRARRPRPPRY